ncbi:MAG: MiaB/RimO family radical SAM methylthiotransferase, partial [Anaerolineae bacterium]|nr:MiaB/RimO family radical SAM methylthiotransferase [Anaerolineae bacterium]
LQPPISNIQYPISCYVPIIEGCNHFCTYCIVRLRRGRERSRPVDEIMEETECSVKHGAREVTLLGQNADAYGHDLPGQPDLADVLTAAHGIEDLWRIRFLTSHPADMKERIIDAVASLPKVCEHIEIPVQSGDDAVLKRMVRGYIVDQYRRLVAKIRERIPGVSLATDVIVGFPGETEEQFANTCRLLEEIRFDTVHVAAYSPRPGTAAAAREDQIPRDIRLARLHKLIDLQNGITLACNRAGVGEEAEVLVDGPAQRGDGLLAGRARNNKQVIFPGDPTLAGSLATVRLTEAHLWGFMAASPSP